MKEINVSDAEQLLIAKVNKINVEDAVYEMAFDLVSKIVDEIESEHYIVDEDGLPCMSDSGGDIMWFDDARDYSMKMLFEKLSEFFKQQTI